MRVAHVVNSSRDGGAAIAARRLHEALLRDGVESWMVTNEKESDVPTRVLVPDGPRARVSLKLARGAEKCARSIFGSSPAQQRSLCLWGGSAPRILEALSPDVIHLHWTTEGSISIHQLSHLARIGKIVWTLHDQWPVSGMAHYPDLRNLSGLGSPVDPQSPLGRSPIKDALALRLGSGLARVKSRRWRSSGISFIAPSEWMRDAATASLGADIDVTVIPNALPPQSGPSRSRSDAKARLGLDQCTPYLLYIAASGISDPRKGWHLVDWMRLETRADKFPVELLVVGPTPTPDATSAGIKIRWIGSSKDFDYIQDCYASAAAVVVPSLIDNAPQVVTEAIQARRRVVAFDVGGMPELLSHGESGYLARAYSIEDLGAGVEWVLNTLEDKAFDAARHRALARWRGEAVSSAHISLYERRLA